MLQSVMQMRRSTLWLGALAVLGLLGGVQHFAMKAPAEPLCWRERPNEKAAQNDIRTVLHALSTEQFDELRLRLSLGSAQEDAAFLRLDRAFAIVEPKFTPAFDGWVAHEPNAFAPRLARANHLLERAWLARGEKSAYETQPSQFAEMARLLELSQVDVAWALRKAPSSRAAHLLQVRLARFTLPEHLSAQTIQEQAIATADACGDHSNEACNTHPNIWLAIANNLQPKWGGSLRALEALRQRAQRSSLSGYNVKIVESHIDCLLRLVKPNKDRSPEQLRANIAQLDQIIAAGPASAMCLQHRIDAIGALRQQLSGKDAATEQTQLRGKQWDDLQRYLAMVPTDFEYALKRAEFYNGKAYQLKKNALIEAAAQLSPGNPEILEARATIAERAHNYDAAIALVRESLRIRPYESRTLLWHAQLLSRDVTKKHIATKQLRALNKRLARFDSDDTWLIASTQWELGDSKGLLSTTEDCARRASFSWCEAMRAAALVDENRLNEARELLNEGGAYAQRWAISRSARAKLFIKQGQIDLGMEQFELAAVERQDPQLYAIWRDTALAQGHCDAIRAAAGQLQSCEKSALCSADRISSLEILENPENAQKCPNLVGLLRL